MGLPAPRPDELPQAFTGRNHIGVAEVHQQLAAPLGQRRRVVVRGADLLGGQPVLVEQGALRREPPDAGVMQAEARSRSSGLLPRYYALRGVGWLTDRLLLFLVPVFTYKITGSLAWSSLALTVQWAPRLLALPVGGLLADRVDDRSFYLVNDVVRCAAGLGAGVLALCAPQAAGAALILFAVVAGVTCEQILVVGEKLATRLVPGHAMTRAQSVLSGIEQGALPAAPALGGALLLLDPAEVMLLFSAMFTLSLLLTLTLPRGPRGVARGGSPVGTPLVRQIARDTAAGVRTIVRTPILRCVVLATMCVNLLLGTLQGTAPDIVVRVFGRTEEDLGTVYTVAGVVAMVTMVAVPRLIGRFGLLPVGAAASVTMGMCFVGLGPMAGFFVFAALVTAFMTADSVFAVFIRTVRISVVPPEEFGRTVSTIFMLNFAPVPVVGVLLATVGPHVPLTVLLPVFGSAVLLVVVLLMLRLRRLMAQGPHGRRAGQASADVTSDGVPAETPQRMAV
ncbi:MFS transporter [Streptomyces sp. NPDC059161]|uniref:MFS transporter n=1 Tax=Streptomyces sp. NPDC059161 TaxID=3346749 RepID=UPI00368DCEB6